MRNQLTNVSVKTPKALEHPGTVDDVTYTTETTQNKYGASGKRIERLEKGITTRYYYTGDALLYSTNEKNVLETENILDPAGSVIASKRFLDPSELGTEKYANKYYIFNYDTRNSVTNVIAPNGTVVKGYDYDEFGNTEQKGEEDCLNDITFTSSVADTSSNLQYMNSRFYQPSTGRFLSQDSYSGNPYDPWTHHLYSYCGNNPINYNDPTGHTSIKTVFGGIAALTVLLNMLSNDDENFKGSVDELLQKYEPVDTSSKEKGFFGANYRDTVSVDSYKTRWELGPLSIVDGIKHDWAYYNSGDSARPISVYAKTKNGNPAKASAGLLINFGELEKRWAINLNLSGEDIGFKLNIHSDEIHYNSYYMRINMLDGGLYFGSEQVGASVYDKNITTSTYQEFRINYLKILEYLSIMDGAKTEIPNLFPSNPNYYPNPVY